MNSTKKVRVGVAALTVLALLVVAAIIFQPTEKQKALAELQGRLTVAQDTMKACQDNNVQFSDCHMPNGTWVKTEIANISQEIYKLS